MIFKCKNCNRNFEDFPYKKRKFCSLLCLSINRRKIKVEAGGTNPQLLRNYILDQQERQCEQCNLTHWQEKLIPIELDHINGNPEDNSLSNLRLLCPNCHAQTDTYKARNRGNGRAFRRARYASGKSY